MSMSRLASMLAIMGSAATMAALPPDLLPLLPMAWEWNARPEQLIPAGDWVYWLVCAGRGFGKTRVGAETTRIWSRTNRYVNLIGATVDDARDIMIDGESGIMAICPPDERPVYVKSDRLLRWPSGCKSLIFTADEPERLRGKQHEKIWADELAAWRYPEAWTQAKLGLRLGSQPQAVVTTTPRPTPIVKKLLANKRTHVTRGSTYDNRANLARDFFEELITEYEGTHLGRQELNAEVIEDLEGALWTHAGLDEHRVDRTPQLERIVIGVDPATTSGEQSDMTGLSVVGLGVDGHAYVLSDPTLKATPEVWAQKVVDLYTSVGANLVVAETNQGGELVTSLLKGVDATVPVRGIHAKHGKRLRAEPVSMLYEQGRVHHVGTLSKLEDQLCSFNPGTGKSPDRVDALVYAVLEVMAGHLVIPKRPVPEVEAGEAHRLAMMEADLERMRQREGFGGFNEYD